MITYQVVSVDQHRKQATDYLIKEWAADFVVSRGVVHKISELNGFVALQDGILAGVLTYKITGDSCELVTINSVEANKGVGTALLKELLRFLHLCQCHRLWCIATNDNVDALKFYQRRGFVITALRKDAIEESRKLKPQIPEKGYYGIPIRDEIELEMVF